MAPPGARPEAVPVAIVGAGPVGLALALGLARHGVRSMLLEQRAGLSEHSKAPGIHVRTREVFRRWEVEGPLLADGTLLPSLTLHGVPHGRPLASADFTRIADEAEEPGLLVLEQSRTEEVLLEAVRASGRCDVRFSAEVVDVADDGRVHLGVREGAGLRRVTADYAVGCDGASSSVRDLLGLPFDGRTYALAPLLADVELGDPRDALPWPRLRNDPVGLTAAVRLRPGRWRIIRLEHEGPPADAPVPPEEVQRLVGAVLGGGPVAVTWASRFRIHRRAVPSFRCGRVLLAGDAAHVHSPVGGQGMNAGIQDAHNLAWKLAAALDGGHVDRLLDSYDVERREVVVGSVSRYTDVLTRVFLQSPAPLRGLAFAVARASLAVPGLRERSLRRGAMLDLGYSRRSPLLAGGRGAAGARLPDALLTAPGGGRVRLHHLLGTRAAILDVARSRPFAEGLPLPVVRVGPGAHGDPSGALRRVLGRRDGFALVRPDQHVGWVGERRGDLETAIPRALGGA